MADQVRLKGPELHHRPLEPVASGSGTSHTPYHQPAPSHAVLRADLSKASNPSPASEPQRSVSQPASAWSAYKPDVPADNIVRVRLPLSLFLLCDLSVTMH